MWNKESQQQSVLNQYPQPFLCNQNSCMRFFQGKSILPPKSPSTSAVVKSSCRSSLLNGNNDAIVNKINGHQIKDLQKSTSCKISSSIKNSFLLEPKAMRKPRIASSSSCDCSIKCDCKNGLTNCISGIGLAKAQKIDTNIKVSITNGHYDHNHRKKNAKLKIDDIDLDEKEFVLKSTQRLQFLKSITETSVPTNNITIEKLLELKDSLIEIKINRKQSVVGCQSKRMRSSPTSVSTTKIDKRVSKNIKDKPSKIIDSAALLFKCEWHDCSSTFSSSENLTKHVQSGHILPTTDNEVFVCLWRGCKFSNQPSCSFKWLSKHVVGHCDLKPFKCVIFGCDMTFVTQNGLARHVPTHFNESRVRRACVITNEATKPENCKQKDSSNVSLVSCVSTTDGDSKQKENEEKTDQSRLQNFVNQNTNLTTCRNYSSKTDNHIKKKVQQGTCHPSTNSGYIKRVFRIDHKVIGRRTCPDGTAEMFLTPTLSNLFHNSSFWCDAKDFRKRKHNHVDIQVKDLSEEIKNRLYDAEHGSISRRRKKRK